MISAHFGWKTDLANDSYLWPLSHTSEEHNQMGKYISNTSIKVWYRYFNVYVLFLRFCAAEIRDAVKEMSQKYDKDLIGKVALSVYRHHNSSGVTYEFGEDTQEYFDKILDNLASQFNSHYNLEEDFSDS